MSAKDAILYRMFLIFGVILLIPLAIAVQMLRIHFVAGDGLQSLWEQQAIDTLPIPAKRGNIYDVNGRLMVGNTVSYKVALDPLLKGFSAADLDTVCYTMAKHSSKNEAYYRNKIKSARKGSRYIVLEKSVPHSTYMDLKALHLRALILEKSFKRVYNFNELAAHVLGYVNYNMDGQTGIEKQFNQVLKGVDGEQQVRRDKFNRVSEYVGAPKKLPKNGANVYTTIDLNIQAIAETELSRGVIRNKANSGVAVVMDVKTGAVRAMASYPNFDPNHPSTLNENNRRNSAIADMIEPGSTFKLISAVAAVDQGVIKEGEIFKTPEDGKKKVHGLWMRDHDPLGDLTFAEVIAKSSNVATSDIAQRISKDKFYQYVRNLGFGTPTNIELPDEATGRLARPLEWSEVTLPFMSIGYEILVTPLQMCQAYGAFANDGVLMKPSIIQKVVDDEGDVSNEFHPEKVRRSIDDEVVDELIPIFKQVVSDSGTAPWARIEGLEVAGKTGTAKKVKNGRYTTAYRASFAGFFPADDPVYVCYVMLDEPRTSIYGGYAAGPVFRRIAERIGGAKGLRKDWLVNAELTEADSIFAFVPDFVGLSVDEADKVADAFDLDIDVEGSTGRVMKQNPKAGTMLLKDQGIQLFTENLVEQADRVTVPDVRGMSMKRAVQCLKDKGLEVRLERSGTVYTQFPLPGEQMSSGRTVVIKGKAKPISELVARGGRR